MTSFSGLAIGRAGVVHFSFTVWDNVFYKKGNGENMVTENSGHRADAHGAERQSPHPKRRGLGRGLSALIPDSQSEDLDQVGRPLDILLPRSSRSRAQVTRGGSARDLLSPTFGRTSAGGGRSRPDDPVAMTKEHMEQGDVSDAVPDHRNTQSSTTAALPSNQSATNGGVSRETLRSQSPAEAIDSNTPIDESSRETQEAPPISVDDHELVKVPGATFADVPLGWITPNTRQPRSIFDEEELHELSESIREVGVLQPIVIRPITDADMSQPEVAGVVEAHPDVRYELIMGERRLRASELAGEPTIPAIIKHTDDQDLLRDALLENLHRSQLNAIEEASAYAQLMDDFGATQEQLSKKIARSRPQIANTLRLLKLPTGVQKKVAAGVLSAGHARALLGIDSSEGMEAMADRVIAEGLSVRTTEEIIRLGRTHRTVLNRASSPKKDISERARAVELKLADLYDTRVTVTEGARKGRIVIEFAGSDDLSRIMGIINSQDGQKEEL